MLPVTRPPQRGQVGPNRAVCVALGLAFADGGEWHRPHPCGSTHPCGVHVESAFDGVAGALIGRFSPEYLEASFQQLDHRSVELACHHDEKVSPDCLISHPTPSWLS